MTDDPPVPRSVLPIRSLLHESASAITSRPVRSAMTLAGLVVGVATVVAILGITASARSDVRSAFTALEAREVKAVSTPIGDDAFAPLFTDDERSVVEDLAGVQAAGSRVVVGDGRSSITRSRDQRLAAWSLSAPVIGVSDRYLDAANAQTSSGRGLAQPTTAGQPVAIVGAALARTLELGDPRVPTVIYVDDLAVTVVGILGRADAHPDLLSAVIVTEDAVTARWGAEDLGAIELLVKVQPGAADVVGDALAIAARPKAPESLAVQVPPTPTGLRDDIDASVRSLFLALAGVSLLIGAFGIANTNLIAVMERIPEFGLRRALGAKPRHVALQVVTESTVLGLIGGLGGAALGLVAISTVAILRSWTPVISAPTVLLAPLIGTAIGAAAGLYPARRAARIEPVEALRR